MCITALKANLVNTYIGVWDIHHPTFGYRHVLAYQNTPKNLSATPNCMLLHIPTKQALEARDLLDTSNDPEFLEQMAHSALPPNLSVVRGVESAGPNFVLEMGIYHVALLNQVDYDSWLEVRSLIPASKQPMIQEGFFEFYAKHFPSFALVVCCFNTRDAKKASPIMVHYAPQFPDVFHFPTIDSHGAIPRLDAVQAFHQIIITGSQQLKSPGNGFKSFDLSTVSEELRPFIPKIGAALDLNQTKGPNLDLLLEAQPVRTGGDAQFDFGLLRA